jgi:hypothetical protein
LARVSSGIAVPARDEAWEMFTLTFSYGYGYFLWVITQISSRTVVLIHIPRLPFFVSNAPITYRSGTVVSPGF